MTLIVLGIVGVALALRLIDLGTKALHHDESLHATYSWYLSSRGQYEHDPLMHGPFQFHMIAAFFKLFGDGDTIVRTPAALGGTALALTPLLLRRWLGGPGTIAASLFLALSPALLYYSRFARGDIFVALWSALLIAAIWRYQQEGRERWLALVAAALALSFSTKETAYLTAAIVLLYLNVVVALELARQRGAAGARRAVEAAALLPVAWLLAALWRPLAPARRAFRLAQRPRAADLLVIVGTLTLPFLAAAAQFAVGDVEPASGPGVTIWICGLIAASALVGLLWSPRWLPIAVVAYAIILPLFTTWFTNADGFRSGFWGQLDYWLEQQEVNRGNQPGFYYFMMLPLYEFLTLVPALVGGAWLVFRRRDHLATLLLLWLGGTFVALSFAGEKMPWLTVHLALPSALLAAYAVGRAWPALWRAVREGRLRTPARAGVSAGAAVAAVALVLSARSALNVSFDHPDTPVEPLIYVQTTPDVPLIAREIEEFVAANATPVVVDTTASLTWPWAWYLRHVPGVSYESPERVQEGVATGAVLIAERSTVPADSPLRAGYQRSERYRHRWWFEEGWDGNGYRATSFGSLADGLLDGSLLRAWATFLVERGGTEGIGALEGEVFFPATPAGNPG